MEIIARKGEGFSKIYLTSALVGTIPSIMFVLLSILYRNSDYVLAFITMACVFAALPIIGLTLLLLYKKAPEVMIVYEDGKLKFPDGSECEPKALKEIVYHTQNERSVKYLWGTLELKTVDRKYKFRYVREITAVAARLNELKKQGRRESRHG